MSTQGSALLVILFFFGLSAGAIGKLKGSSFGLWFAVGFFIPFLGVVAALLYRNERDELRRRCPGCGRSAMLGGWRGRANSPTVAVVGAQRGAAGRIRRRGIGC